MKEVDVDTVLLVVALVCFALAALQLWKDKVNLIAAGLFFWALTALI